MAAGRTFRFDTTHLGPTMALDASSTVAIATATLLLLTLWAVRRGQRGGSSRRSSRKDAIDTVIGWQPEAARVLTTSETQAFEILVRSMPDHRVLAQVPLSRFLRVPTRNSYSDWLSRVGNLNADLLLCDAESRVLAVIDVRATQESDRSRRRHERMMRVLRAAGIPLRFLRRPGDGHSGPRPLSAPYCTIACANSRASKVCRSSSFSPTPMK
jgi:hypothetical protein